MKELRIIIAGGRDFNDYDVLESKVSEYILLFRNSYDFDKINIISGGAKGADLLGEKYAYEYLYNSIRFPANWELHGKAAGPIRNKQMANYACKDGNIGVLIAFWNGKSKGTKSMIELAKNYKLTTTIVMY